jgi:hypothetical protein
MSPTTPLTTEECQILEALVDPDADVPDRTVGRLVTRVDLSPKLLATRLRELETRTPPLAELVGHDDLGLQAWWPTDAGRQAYEDGCR